MNRRTFVAGAGGIGLVGLSGCLGVVGMDEHVASPAGVAPETRDETGYDQTGIEEVTVRERVDFAGVSEEVVVRNYLTEHEKMIEIEGLVEQPLAVFLVLTTPQVSILGRDLNPIAEMESVELLELLVENYDEIGDVTHDTDETVTILGQETTASRFEAEARFDGHDLDVYVHVSESVETEGDHLVTIGVYPRLVAELESENVRSLMEGVVEEPAD